MEELNFCKLIRKRYGLSQKQLADELGKSVRTIRNWEKAEVLKPRILLILVCFDTDRAL
jgi:transcriptional regulator with XRE-family HTH domain